MSEQLQEKLLNFLSRKFLIAVFAIVVLILGIVPQDKTWEFVVAVLGYLTVEGTVDLINKPK